MLLSLCSRCDGKYAVLVSSKHKGQLHSLCCVDILQLLFHIFSICSDNLNLEMMEGCLQPPG